MRPILLHLRIVPAVLLLGSAAVSAAGQSAIASRWTFDPQLLLARSDTVMRKAPESAIDDLFQAVRHASTKPEEMALMCAFFDPGSRHDLAAVNQAALQFSPDSQRRFQRATDRLLQVHEQEPDQPYDDAVARQSLRQAAVAAGMLFEGFVAAIQSEGRDAASRQARCRALNQLLGTVSMRPRNERVMITRLLMREGLRRIER
ncbi:MAG: hypothetical protein DI635_05730 [Pseudoxanthomonas suwonensis]|nr:MAG: hypothetical protein DI635_05730 [Pseudoxanthomonas suwonensis]